MTRYTEELLKISNNFFSLRSETFLKDILQVPSNYSIFCLFKDYDEEQLYNLTRTGMKSLAKEGITAKEKNDTEQYLAIVLGAFQARYEEFQLGKSQTRFDEHQNESDLI